MKSLHVLPMNKLSGAEKLALILCKNMKNDEPIVVCGGEDLKSIFKKNNIKSYSIDFKDKNPIKIFLNLRKIIKNNNIKIVHAHDNIASIFSYLTIKIFHLDAKVLSHIHICYPWLESNNLNKLIDTFFRKRYDHNIACGKEVFEYYKKNSDFINHVNTTTLSNAIDVEEIRNYVDMDRERAYREFSIPKRKVIIGFVGRLSEQKGIIPFIYQLAKQKEKFEECQFLLIGSGDQEEEIKSLIKNLELEELFKLTGHQDNVYKFYPLIDIFFLPSINEGLPMVILEAMCFEKPVVAMDVGSISEIIKNEHNGFIISNLDYQQFIKSLLYLKNQELKRKQFGENAYHSIKKDYDITNYGASIKKIYISMLKLEG
ncbi:glycosyltransferase family 4 protein [Gottfriedia sp. NPDC058432]|uniref:glycosyltransferase family 4 protein n=1 Tax=unclassified Gottfriedia TaxID=2837516 RepID=UPI00365E0C63